MINYYFKKMKKLKKLNKKQLGMLALGVLALGGVGFSTAKAYQGDYSQKGPNYSEERHQLMQEAFDNNDYQAWKDLMGDRKGRVMELVDNEENFSKFAEARRLALEGKTEEAKALRAELGLRDGHGMRDGSGYGKKGMGRGMNR
jgi:hypothetical protein